MDTDPSVRPGSAPQEDEIEIRVIAVNEIPSEPRDRPTENLTAIGQPEHDGLRIYVYSPALNGINRHLVSDTRREQGGVLLGNLCHDNNGEPFVDITDFIIARHTESSGVHLHFTIATWKAVDEEREQRYPNNEKIVVGWYHSHPGLGVFVSGQDRQVHQQFLSWWQTALVVDPVAREMGFFRNKGEWLLMCEGVYVYGGPSPVSYAQVPPFRQTLTRQVEPEFKQREPAIDNPPRPSEDRNRHEPRQWLGITWATGFLLVAALLGAFLGGVLARDVFVAFVVLLVGALALGLGIFLLVIGAFLIRPHVSDSDVVVDEMLELASESVDLQNLVVTVELVRGSHGGDRAKILARCRHHLFCHRLDKACAALSAELDGGEPNEASLVSYHISRLSKLGSDFADSSHLAGLMDAFWSAHKAFAGLPAPSFRVQSEMSLKPWGDFLMKYHEMRLRRESLCESLQNALRNNTLSKDISDANQLLQNLEGDGHRKQHYVESILDDLMVGIESLTDQKTLVAMNSSVFDGRLLESFPSYRDRFVAWRTSVQEVPADGRTAGNPTVRVEIPLG